MMKDVQTVQQELIAAGWGRGTTQEQLYVVARLAIAYDLDPILGHLTLQHGQPYVTVPGLLFKAADRLDGCEVRLVSSSDAGAIGESGEVFARAEITVKGWTKPSVAYGRAGGQRERNPVGRVSAFEMAQTRAIGRALRPIAAIGLSFAEEIGEAEWRETSRSGLEVLTAMVPPKDVAPPTTANLAEVIREKARAAGLTGGQLVTELRLAGAETIVYGEGRKLDLAAHSPAVLATVLARLEEKPDVR